jgi:myosin-1
VIAANGELMEKGHTTSEAIYGRDAFAKVLALHLICRKVITK